MRYIFFGTAEFAAIILKRLVASGLRPVLVVTNPDRPAGRKKIITPPPVKIAALENRLRVSQPEKLEVGNWKSEIDKLGGVDLAVVTAYGKIIPEKILETLPNKFIGVHPSLLPKYRGATPIQSAILSGDKVTGLTLFLMDEQIDHGPILAEQKLEDIEKLNYRELHDKLADLGGELLVQTIQKYVKGEFTLRPQNDKEAIYTKKFKDDDAYVDLEKDNPAIIERKVRALNPEPGAWTLENNKRLKILEAEIVDGKLKLLRIQFEGKKPQNL